MNINLPDEEMKKMYYNSLHLERIKTRYLQLRRNVTWYALEFCISNYGKIGLTETEIECIKERSHTFIIYYTDFNQNQKENFRDVYSYKTL
jgi:hypothetical protein